MKLAKIYNVSEIARQLGLEKHKLTLFNKGVTTELTNDQIDDLIKFIDLQNKKAIENLKKSKPSK